MSVFQPVTDVAPAATMTPAATMIPAAATPAASQIHSGAKLSKPLTEFPNLLALVTFHHLKYYLMKL